MSGIANMVFANRTPPAVGGGGGPTDEYWSDVGLLLHMDGSDNGTTFTDSSLTASAWTATGGARTDTGRAKFGTASYEMQGINSDSPQSRGIIWANSATYTDLKMSGNFTYEFFYYTTNTGSLKGLSSYGFFSFLIYINGTTVTAEMSSTTAGATSVQRTLNLGSISANTWNHVAMCRTGANVEAWINGTRTLNIANLFTNDIRTFRTADGSASDYFSFGSTNHTGTTTQHMGGWLDEVRITQGVARYTGATITVPTAEFPNS